MTVPKKTKKKQVALLAKPCERMMEIKKRLNKSFGGQTENVLNTQYS